MEMEITKKSVIYEGKEYESEDIKVTVSLKNRQKGNLVLVSLVLVYVIIFASMFGSSLQNTIFPSYFFPIWAVYTVSFLWFFFVIRSRYYLEFATIDLGKDKKLKLLYSGKKGLFVEKIIGIAGSIDYINS
jgi:hypothetical protein